jgi:hypothetical protein
MVYYILISGRRVGKTVMDSMLREWRNATAGLEWGAQRVLHNTLDAVAKDGVHLVHGSDYRDGKPCLINAAGQMLASGGGHGIPSSYFGPIVGLFDRINAALVEKGVNDDTGYVSPLAAEILLRHFATLKPIPDEASLAGADVDAITPYVEPSDSEIAESWVNAMKAPAPSELDEPAVNPVDGFNKDFIKGSIQNKVF